MIAVGGVATVWPAPGAPPIRLVTPAVPAAEERVVSGPLLGRTAAWLTVGDAAARVRVRFARMPGVLYRVSTGADAGIAPVVTRRDGRVTVRLTRTGRDGLDEVRIVLNRQVRWDIRLPAGAGEQQLNLRDGRVQRLEVGSAGLAEVWLPEPEGTVPIVFTGGVGTAVVSVGGGVPVRLRLAEGAGSVETPWTTNNGTAAGTVLHDPGFRQVRDRYAIRAEGGLGTLVVRQSPDHALDPAGPGHAPGSGGPGYVPGSGGPGNAPGSGGPGNAPGPGREPWMVAPWTAAPRRDVPRPGTADHRPRTGEPRPATPRRTDEPAATTSPPRKPATPKATTKATTRTSPPNATTDRTSPPDAANTTSRPDKPRRTGLPDEPRRTSLPDESTRPTAAVDGEPAR
jgi:hypothetical protein